MGKMSQLHADMTEIMNNLDMTEEEQERILSNMGLVRQLLDAMHDMFEANKPERPDIWVEFKVSSNDEDAAYKVAKHVRKYMKKQGYIWQEED